MQFYDHDSPEAITYKNNSRELENWLDHLTYIDKEISSLLKIAISDGVTLPKFQALHLSLETKREEIIVAIDEFKKYQNNLPKAAECEDVSCDMFYVNEHDRYRNSYRVHLENYRKIKEEYLLILHK